MSKDDVVGYVAELEESVQKSHEMAWFKEGYQTYEMQLRLANSRKRMLSRILYTSLTKPQFRVNVRNKALSGKAQVL